MHTLAIGSDRTLFDPRSTSAQRQIAYGQHFDGLDIIIFSRRRHALRPASLDANVHIYPTASWNRLWYIFDALKIARRLQRPDVITVQDPFESGLAGLIIAQRMKVPLHVQVHTDFFAPAFARHSQLNRLRVFIAGIVLRRATRIRVVSERIKVNIEKRYATHSAVTVLPIFVDIERFKHAHAGTLTEKFSRFRTKLLIVSRLEKEKDVAVAITSFKAAAPEDACLIILGDGSERKRLETIAPKRVFFESWQDPTPYYALADLVVVPSQYEGYGLTIVEALAAGKPVLATDVGIAKEAGAIIAPADAFAAVLAKWFETGPRKAVLNAYPYRSFDEYARAYSNDILACITN